MTKNFLDEEFWWMLRLGLPIRGSVQVALSRWSPPDEDTCFEIYDQSVDVLKLLEWADGHDWENIHRSLQVDGAITNGEPVVGPLVVDIDTDEYVFDSTAKPSDVVIEDARQIVFKALTHLSEQGVPKDDRRVYFSGHKGFHIEYVLVDRPSMHNAYAHDDESSNSPSWQNEMKKIRQSLSLGETSSIVIDPVHDFVRLKTSINRWGPPRLGRGHRVTKIAEEDLPGIAIDQIWRASQVESTDII